MKKYRVTGTYTVSISKEVWAFSEEQAIELAEERFGGVETYINNTVGVDGDGEDISADGIPDWEDAYVEELENDPNHRECPRCGEELEEYTGDNGEKFWKCEYGCATCFDEDGEEVDPTDYFEMEYIVDGM